MHSRLNSLRSTRWLLSASPRHAKEKLKILLTVDQDVQSSFLRNYITWFSSNTRKVKPAARGRLRLSVAEWDKLVDYTCVMRAVTKEIKLSVASEEGQDRAIQLVEDAFMARCDVLAWTKNYVQLVKEWFSTPGFFCTWGYQLQSKMRCWSSFIHPKKWALVIKPRSYKGNQLPVPFKYDGSTSVL